MDCVYITKTASFLPNEPVESDYIEDYLGMIGGKPSKARNLILRNNQIKTRYYALDREQRVTHSSFEMAKLAIEKLYDNDINADTIELLAAGTASQEMIMPSHGVQIHGEMGGHTNREVVSFAGSCCSGIHALKYVSMAIASGDKSNAVAVASERLSAWMRSSFFKEEYENLKRLEQDPMIAFEKDFLRFMLSDGASALLLKNRPAESGLSLRVEWIELTSYANTMPTCMYAGADYNSEGKLLGWCGFEEEEWTGRSLFALKQDTKLLGENIVKLGGRFLMEVAQKRSLRQEEIDWFLPHLSSMYFRSKIFTELDSLGFTIPQERWFVNLPSVGNIAAASAFIMIDELLRSGRLKKGEKILVMVPESARFSYAFVYLTVCDYEG
jgi:3-oxoacyl-[acyl-carrier-protein] synthase-3